jgi:hypothetical protein
MKIQYNFVDFSGRKWVDAWVDSYNNYTDEIEQKENAGDDVEWLKNARHNFFYSIVTLDQKN